MSFPSNTTEKEQLLVQLLAVTVKITYKLQSVHWNIRGPLFDSVHRRTEEQYTETFAAQDVLAERLRSLGSFAPNSLNEVMMEGADVTCRLDIPDAVDMVKDLVEANLVVSRVAARLAEVAEAEGDRVTSDLAVSRSASHDKFAWLYRSLVS